MALAPRAGAPLILAFVLVAASSSFGCGRSEESAPAPITAPPAAPSGVSSADSNIPTPQSSIRSVKASPGQRPGLGFKFAVTVQSDDTGCDRYADWWEVVTPDGELIYRRVLTHSHVDEQPFTRPGGPVPVSADQTVLVRVHSHPSGYSDEVWTGSVDSGFEATTLPSFAVSLEHEPPLPRGCRF